MAVVEAADYEACKRALNKRKRKERQQEQRELQEVAERDVAELQHRQAEQEREFEESQKGKVGQDPTWPWHPLLNPSAEDITSQQIREAQYASRKPFQPHWDEVIEGVLAGLFIDRKAISERYDRPECWSGGLLKLAIEQGYFTKEGLKGYFSQAKRLRSESPSSSELTEPPEGAITRTILERLCVLRFGVGLAMFAKLMRLGAWYGLEPLLRDLGGDRTFGKCLRAILIREGLLSSGDWTSAFQATDWRRLTTRYLERTAEESPCPTS